MNTAEHLETCLTEECAEIIHILCKVQRFSLGDRNVLDPSGPTNVERLVDEVNDLLGVLTLLDRYGILPPGWRSEEKQLAKINKVLKFMDYARQKGSLRD